MNECSESQTHWLALQGGRFCACICLAQLLSGQQAACRGHAVANIELMNITPSAQRLMTAQKLGQTYACADVAPASPYS